MDLNIKLNPKNGGEYCNFEVNGKKYYADKAGVPFCGEETMIFAYEEDGNINWTDLYCDRSGKSLEDCINEFINSIS